MQMMWTSETNVGHFFFFLVIMFLNKVFRSLLAPAREETKSV